MLHALEDSGRDLRLVSLGRLVPRKGVDVVVRALAQLPDAELVVAGGPEADALFARLQSDVLPRTLV